MNALVDAGANIEDPLYSSAFYGQANVVEALLNASARRDAVSNLRRTALLIYTNIDGKTALFQAAKRGYLEIVKMLLARGANPNHRDNYGRSALDIAKDRNHDQVVSMLQAFKGSPLELLLDIRLGNLESVREAIDRLEADVRGFGGCTPLMIAVQYDQLDIVKLLLFRGRNASRLTAERDDIGRTALHYAAQTGNMTVARLLLAEGASNQIADEHGITPLALAAMSGQLDVVRGLNQHALRSGASQVLAGIDSLQSSSMLHLAVGSTSATIEAIEAVVGYLLSVTDGADVNTTDANGWTVLHLAAKRANGARLVQLLVDKGADVNRQIHAGDRTASEGTSNSEGGSPLHLAAQHGNVDSIRGLIS